MPTKSVICYIVVLLICQFSPQADGSFFSITDEKAVYVDPSTGSDRHPGSIEKPFRTIQKAIISKNKGGKIFLRGGIYKEQNIKINGLRHLIYPLEIAGYLNEKAIIDGAINEFYGPSADSWKLYSSSKNIYESIKSFKQYKNFHGQIRIDNAYIKLVSYKNMEDLSSENGFFNTTGNLYVGPGFYFSKKTGKIYIRLEKPSNLPPKILFFDNISVDPNKNDIALSPVTYGFIISKCTSRQAISLSRISIANTYASILISSSQNINITDINFFPAKYGVLIKDGSRDVRVSASVFNQNIPDWIAWSDVKISTKPAHSLQNNDIEINAYSQNITIEDSIFNKSWDAINAISTANNLHFLNNKFFGVRDDCIQLGSSTTNVEIGYNRMRHVFTGISRHGSGSNTQPGSKYIHHNIIDCTKPMYVVRTDPDETLNREYAWMGSNPMMNNPPFGIHRADKIGLDPFKIYNNTVVFRMSPSRHGTGTSLLGPQKSTFHRNEVYNNIFIQLDDAEILRNVDCDSGYEIYDGNIYYKASKTNNYPIFRDFICDGNKVSFYNLNSFKKSNCFFNSLSHYSKGFETNGFSGNPLIKDLYIPSKKGPANNNFVHMHKDWPDSNSQFIGALFPN